MSTVSSFISVSEENPPISAAEQHIIFWHSSWATYQRLLAEREGIRPRLAYDQGVLEIMTTSLQHEKLVRLFEALINALALVFNVDFESAGETTYQRADLQRGFEPDGSYYFNNPQQIRSKRQLDLTVDPAPDLVIEVDLTHSSLDKHSIMAALGIREIWRYQDNQVSILRLVDDDNAAEHYRIQNESECFPSLNADQLSTWIEAGLQLPRPLWLQQIHNEAKDVK